ncbi:MAG: SEC-C domain-containing protein [Deltaproteobacteria bacterium]|jgi:hypothetical protein|nr:SEC-C domain-containing protein [Deltaproteobacteria bacterium]
MPNPSAKRIFDRYNSPSEIESCPLGRETVRDELDVYARAAVNLYGVISVNKLVEIYNSQNQNQTTTGELTSLLLPFALQENPRYCFYKKYIVNYLTIDDFGAIDEILGEQFGKPRYTPKRAAFLKFADEFYEDEKQRRLWRKVFDGFNELWPEEYKRYRAFYEIQDYVTYNIGISRIGKILSECELIFPGQEEAEKFFATLFEAKANTRLIENKGHRPLELRPPKPKTPPTAKGDQDVVIKHSRFVGKTEPCPCGSGKKYKDCCLPTILARTAQLKPRDCNLFYDTWYGLLNFVNSKLKLCDGVLNPSDMSDKSFKMVATLRKSLWQNVGLIDECLAESNLPQEKFDLLKSWRDFHIEGDFMLVEHRPEYSLMLGQQNKEDNLRLFCVKGVQSSIAEAMQIPLPVPLSGVLLPFKDKIVYDTILIPMPVKFGEGMMEQIDRWYENANALGLVTTLPAS